jgi:hypothetical protein
MVTELMLSAFLVAVGLAVAGAGTHLYQMLSKQQAMLRYDGKTLLHTFGHLAVSFLCGPYIMLQLGWNQERGGTLSVSSALISAVVAFGWSFITGLIIVGTYLAILG